MTITCEFVLSIWVTVWRRNTIAAVVEPVGRNTNWSFNKDAVDGWLKAGYKNCRTIDFSMILVSTGVIDIGRKSVLDLAVATFGTGRITALFYWRGTTEEDRDRLNSLASCSLKTCAPSLRNQAGWLRFQNALMSLVEVELCEVQHNCVLHGRFLVQILSHFVKHIALLAYDIS